MSILNVDKIQPIGGGSTITVDATDIQATSATITASKFVGSGDLSVTGVSTFTGNIDANGDLDVDGHTELDNVNASGIVTATSFVGALTGNVTGNATGLSGTPNISAGTIAGSTGTFTGDVDIADKIVHTGDTNTAIRFPAADTITAETGGSERVRIDSSGNVLVGTTDSTIYNQNSDEGIVLRNGEAIDIARSGDLQLTLNRMSNEGPNIALYQAGGFKATIGTKGDGIYFGTSGDTERLRINSSGKVRVGSGNPTYNFEVQTTGFVESLIGSTNAGGAGIILDGDANGDGSGGDYAQIFHQNDGTLNFRARNGSGGTDTIFLSNTTETLRIKSDGDIEATGNLQTNNLSGRNVVINGDMRVAQRATSASMSNAGNDIPVCDRWNYNRNGVTATVAQVEEAPAGRGFKYSLKWTSTSAVGSIAAGNNLKFAYKIERQDIQRLGYGSSNAKKATLSFWAKGSLAGKIGVSCTRNSRITSHNVDMTANTWEFHEIVIPIDTSTALSGTDTDSGFDFGFCWGAGSNSTSGATNGWINFHNAYTAGFTAGQQGAYLTTSGSTFQITGVQLEIGSVSTPFEHRKYGDVLRDCCRYYQTVPYNLFIVRASESIAYSNAPIQSSFILPELMRSNPTGSNYTDGGSTITVTYYSASYGSATNYEANITNSIHNGTVRFHLNHNQANNSGTSLSTTYKWGQSVDPIAFSAEL